MADVYCHVSMLHNDAGIEMGYWIYQHREEIKEVKERNGVVICNNGDKHYFMGDIIYREWCLGKTYILNGKRYRSGYEIKEVSD